MMGRNLRLLFGLLLLGLGLAITGLTSSESESAPLAQATATPTATATATATRTPTPTITPTATLPPLVPYGDGMAVQSFPEARINCTLDVVGSRGGGFECVSGTPVPPRPTPDPLLVKLAHYWPLAGGDWSDTVGALDLTASGTVTSAEGGTAAGFNGGYGNYLATAQTLLLGGHSWTYAFWLKGTDTTWAGAARPFGSFVTSFGDMAEGYLGAQSIADDARVCGETYAPGFSASVQICRGSALTLNAWHQGVLSHDVGSQTLTWAVDGSVIDTVSMSFVMEARPLVVFVGAEAPNGDGWGMQGAMKHVGLWVDRVADQPMIDALYAGGAGWAGPP